VLLYKHQSYIASMFVMHTMRDPMYCTMQCNAICSDSSIYTQPLPPATSAPFYRLLKYQLNANCPVSR
jgi:hypothetical protein